MSGWRYCDDTVPHEMHALVVRYRGVLPGGHPSRLFTMDEARAIRASTESARSIARRLGVTHHAINLIRSGRTYKEA